jgi:hypothetical protein
MKPMSPEDRDPEKVSSEVSEKYRAGAADEPSSRLDAAVLDAAHREVQPRRPRQRHWQVPASIAAVLVIGVSLVLLVRNNEPMLPSLDRPAAKEAKLAKSAPPQLAMKGQPKAKADSLREDRPGRERSERPARETVARDEAPKQLESAATGTATPSAAATAALSGSATQEKSPIAEPGADSLSKKAVAVGDVESKSRENAQAPGRQEAPSPNLQQDWLRKIDDLLREGKQAEARRQLLDFREQYPDYPLAERFQMLLPPAQR